MLTADVTGGVTAVMTTKTCAGTTRGGITQTGERMMGITDPGPISPTSATTDATEGIVNASRAAGGSRAGVSATRGPRTGR